MVRVPTLVLWGMADVALLPVLLDGLSDFVPELSVHRLDGLSHWLVHENPQLIAKHLRTFLAPTRFRSESEAGLSCKPLRSPFAQPFLLMSRALIRPLSGMYRMRSARTR